MGEFLKKFEFSCNEIEILSSNQCGSMERSVKLVDETEFEQIYNTYYMNVYSYVMTLTKNQNEAEEITQKTFFKSITTAKKYAGNSSELTWLCAIAKNLFLDELKQKKRFEEKESNEIIAETNLERAFADEETAFRIHQVLHNLDDPYKEVFSLRIFGELSFKKIGLLFGKTENWARVTYHRARLKVQERMDENNENL